MSKKTMYLNWCIAINETRSLKCSGIPSRTPHTVTIEWLVVGNIFQLEEKIACGSMVSRCWLVGKSRRETSSFSGIGSLCRGQNEVCGWEERSVVSVVCRSDVQMDRTCPEPLDSLPFFIYLTHLENSIIRGSLFSVCWGRIAR